VLNKYKLSWPHLIKSECYFYWRRFTYLYLCYKTLRSDVFESVLWQFVRLEIERDSFLGQAVIFFKLRDRLNPYSCFENKQKESK
jgi:hypothetical protein